MTLRSLKLLLYSVLFFSNIIANAQYKIPNIPKIQTSVYDEINLLSKEQKQFLEQKLIRYSDSTSTQIVIATISSTEGEYINYLGAEWAHKWGIGQEKEDNGIFILLAKDDRKIGINTGYGVEHLLTDALSKRIIETDIVPYFKQNDYFTGLNSAVESIFKILQGTYKAKPKKNNASGNKFPVILIIIFIIILFALSKKNGKGGRNGGTRHKSQSILDAIILSNLGRGNYHGRSSSGGGIFGGGFGSGSGGGFSGGGFGGGFGGGGFGGGGASGGW